MSGSHHELHIDVPVKLDEVRAVFSIGSMRTNSSPIGHVDRICVGPIVPYSFGSIVAALASLESVRKHQAGLQSFRSMRRIEASRRNASALRLRFSQSLASLRQRLSQAKVRSTTQRRGSTTNPFVRSERLTISVSS